MEAESPGRKEHLLHDFVSLFTDMFLAEEGNAKLKARWSEYLERWGLLKTKRAPLTALELLCLKRLELLDEATIHNREEALRQCWQETLEALKSWYKDETVDERRSLFSSARAFLCKRKREVLSQKENSYLNHILVGWLPGLIGKVHESCYDRQ